MEIKGTAAIVTGGSGGLGRRICHALARQGANVAVVYDRASAVAQTVADELVALGARAIAVQANVAVEDDVRRMVERVAAEFGRVDILVNDAAYNKWIPFKDLDGLSRELWDQIMAVNATGPYLCARAVAPLMLGQQQGRIVNITSLSGIAPGGSSIAYAVSKAALIHLTRCLAVALAPHVLVNSVAPGTMAGTRMTSNLDPEYAEKGRRAALTGRFVEKDDVADQVLTLIRTDSTTGQTIVVDGGRVFH